jgi:hypothetical protein
MQRVDYNGYYNGDEEITTQPQGLDKAEMED